MYCGRSNAVYRVLCKAIELGVRQYIVIVNFSGKELLEDWKGRRDLQLLFNEKIK